MPRFIPTCVGKASLLDMSISITTVHPHVCGEGSRLIRDLCKLMCELPPNFKGVSLALETQLFQLFIDVEACGDITACIVRVAIGESEKGFIELRKFGVASSADSFCAD